MMPSEGEERLLYQCRWGYTGVGGAEIPPVRCVAFGIVPPQLSQKQR